MSRIFKMNAMLTAENETNHRTLHSVGMVDIDLDDVEEIVIPVNYECEVLVTTPEGELSGEVDVMFSFNEICDLLDKDTFGSPVVIRRDNCYHDRFDIAIDQIYLKLTLGG